MKVMFGLYVAVVALGLTLYLTLAILGY